MIPDLQQLSTTTRDLRGKFWALIPETEGLQVWRKFGNGH
jgi:hypothetical protein